MPVRGDVVEQDQRVGAGRDHVVDAVRGHVGAAGAQRPAPARDHRLRPDRVGRGGEQPALVERVQAGEGAEAARAGRLDGRAQPLDDSLRRRERDPGGGVRPVLAHGPSLRGHASDASASRQLAVQLRPALRAAREEATIERRRRRRSRRRRSAVEQLRERRPPSPPARRRAAAAPSARARPLSSSSSSSQSRGGCTSSR